MRIVSLLPSATEIVASLGLREALVGRSHECDVPVGIDALPVVSTSALDPATLDGAGVDRAVRAAMGAGESLYAIDAELLERLRPDVIVTQELCRVCAVSGDEVGAADARVISLDPHDIAGIAESVRTLGRELGAIVAGRTVAEAMLERIRAVRERVAGGQPRTVFFAEWHDPPFAAGHWVPEQIAAAGGIDPLGRAGQASRRIDWEQVSEVDPELVVVGPCGYDAGRARIEWERLCAAGTVPAHLAERAVVVDGNAHFSRPSPAVAVGVEVLADILHPVR